MRKPSEKRPPPAYQCYAADDLARLEYRRMTLDERGLYDAMLRVQWVDGFVPKDASELAIAVRRPAEEVESALASGRVLEHFESDPEDEKRLICRELRIQKAEILTVRKAQSRGADMTNEKLGNRRKLDDMDKPIPL